MQHTCRLSAWKCHGTLGVVAYVPARELVRVVDAFFSGAVLLGDTLKVTKLMSEWGHFFIMIVIILIIIFNFLHSKTEYDAAPNS